MATTRCQTLPHHSFWSCHHHHTVPPTATAAVAPRDRPHGLSEGSLITDTDPEQPPHPRRLPLPHHRALTLAASATSPPLPLPSLRDVGRQHLPCHRHPPPPHHSPQQPFHAMSPTRTPALERHVMKPEETWRIDGSEDKWEREQIGARTNGNGEGKGEGVRG